MRKREEGHLKLLKLMTGEFHWKKKETCRTCCTKPLKPWDKCTSHYVMLGNRKDPALWCACPSLAVFLLRIGCHLKHNKLPGLYPVTAILGNHKVKTEAAKITRQRKRRWHCRGKKKPCQTQFFRALATVGKGSFHDSLGTAHEGRRMRGTRLSAA